MTSNAPKDAPKHRCGIVESLQINVLIRPMTCEVLFQLDLSPDLVVAFQPAHAHRAVPVAFENNPWRTGSDHSFTGTKGSPMSL
jgi:hypothetical protein